MEKKSKIRDKIPLRIRDIPSYKGKRGSDRRLNTTGSLNSTCTMYIIVENSRKNLDNCVKKKFY